MTNLNAQLLFKTLIQGQPLGGIQARRSSQLASKFVFGMIIIRRVWCHRIIVTALVTTWWQWRASHTSWRHRRASKTTWWHRRASHTTWWHRRASNSTRRHGRASNSTWRHRRAAHSTWRHRRASTRRWNGWTTTSLVSVTMWRTSVNETRTALYSLLTC